LQIHHDPTHHDLPLSVIYGSHEQPVLFGVQPLALSSARPSLLLVLVIVSPVGIYLGLELQLANLTPAYHLRPQHSHPQVLGTVVDILPTQEVVLARRELVFHWCEVFQLPELVLLVTVGNVHQF
jgi:hypothetical protein